MSRGVWHSVTMGYPVACWHSTVHLSRAVCHARCVMLCFVVLPPQLTSCACCVPFLHRRSSSCAATTLSTITHPQQNIFILMGGVFDLSAHPSIQRYADDPQLSYRPLFYVVANATHREAVK